MLYNLYLQIFVLGLTTKVGLAPIGGGGDSSINEGIASIVSKLVSLPPLWIVIAVAVAYIFTKEVVHLVVAGVAVLVLWFVLHFCGII